MFRVFRIKSPLGLSKIEICISKPKDGYQYAVDVLAYSRWYCNAFPTTKECLKWVRQTFYVTKRKENNNG